MYNMFNSRTLIDALYGTTGNQFSQQFSTDITFIHNLAYTVNRETYQNPSSKAKEFAVGMQGALGVENNLLALGFDMDG